MDELSTKTRAGNTGSLIYDRLRADILDGKLAPGMPLSQLAIAKAAGTSRGPVNDALRRLQQDRLVIAHANRRFNVAPFDVSDLEAVFCLYFANNTLAVQISVPFATDEEILELERCADAMDQAFETDDAQWDAAYHGFLFAIIKHSSSRSVHLTHQLLDEIRRHQAIRPGPRVWLKGAEFREIIDAVRGRNGKLAAIRYAEVVGRQGCLVMARIAPTYDAFRMRHYIVTMTQSDAQK